MYLFQINNFKHTDHSHCVRCRCLPCVMHRHWLLFSNYNDTLQLMEQLE